MKSRTKSNYNVNQSPLYKLKSFKQLATVLGVSSSRLAELLKKGRNNYYFSKAPHSDRDIQVPLPQMRRVHKRIQKLLSRIKKPEYLFSGVKGKSNIDNARFHVGQDYLAKLDIKSFYTNTSTDRVFKSAINYFSMVPDVARAFAQLVTVDGYVPTGSPVSQNVAFIANLTLFDEIYKYCKHRKIRFSVYVDDMTFSADFPLHKNLTDDVNLITKRNSSYTLHKFRSFGKDKSKLVTGGVLSSSGIEAPFVQHKKLRKVCNDIKSMASQPELPLDSLAIAFQSAIGLSSCVAQLTPSFKVLTADLVEQRRVLGIKGLNQNMNKGQ